MDNSVRSGHTARVMCANCNGFCVVIGYSQKRGVETYLVKQKTSNLLHHNVEIGEDGSKYVTSCEGVKSHSTVRKLIYYFMTYV